MQTTTVEVHRMVSSCVLEIAESCPSTATARAPSADPWKLSRWRLATRQHQQLLDKQNLNTVSTCFLWRCEMAEVPAYAKIQRLKYFQKTQSLAVLGAKMVDLHASKVSAHCMVRVAILTMQSEIDMADGEPEDLILNGTCGGRISTVAFGD